MSLENSRNLQTGLLRRSPILCTRKRCTKQGTSFCTCQKASLTVEAAVVFPLTAGFLLSILFFFRILFIQAAVEEALVYAGRAVAVESCFVDEESALLLSAEGLFKSAISQESDIQRFVSGGILGVTLLGSEVSGKEIELQANYMVKLPIEFFGVRGIWLTSKNTFVKWKGDLYIGSESGKWVYITETGSVYHKNTGCRSLDLKIRETLLTNIHTIRGASGQKYYPCSRCLNSIDEGQSVYYTDYGRLYHEQLSCSALKRTISRILLSQVGERRPCSYCY